MCAVVIDSILRRKKAAADKNILIVENWVGIKLKWFTIDYKKKEATDKGARIGWQQIRILKATVFQSN